MTPIQASEKSNEKEVDSNLQDRRIKQHSKVKLYQLVRTADFIPSCRIDYLPERYNVNLLLPTKLTLEEYEFTCFPFVYNAIKRKHELSKIQRKK